MAHQQHIRSYGQGHTSSLNGRGANPRPPPGADPFMWQWFTTVDINRDGQITALELQRALKEGNGNAFDIDTVKLMMKKHDTDGNGTIGFDEFVKLKKFIMERKEFFKRSDKDSSNTIDRAELQAALHKQSKCKLTPQLLKIIEEKYAIPLHPPPGSGPSTGSQTSAITFDRFIRACAAVHQVIEEFDKLDSDRDGMITIDRNQFMTRVFSAP